MNKKLVFILSTVVCMLLIVGCCCVNNTRSGMCKKKINKKANYYRANYGTIVTKSDTTIFVKNLSRVYDKGFLKEIGEVKDEKKKGEWFIFGDSLKIKYVIKYKASKADTLYRSFELINYSW